MKEEFCLKQILQEVVESFLCYTPLLLPQLYERFESHILQSIKDLKLDISENSLKSNMHSRTENVAI